MNLAETRAIRRIIAVALVGLGVASLSAASARDRSNSNDPSVAPIIQSIDWSRAELKKLMHAARVSDDGMDAIIRQLDEMVENYAQGVRQGDENATRLTPLELVSRKVLPMMREHGLVGHEAEIGNLVGAWMNDEVRLVFLAPSSDNSQGEE